jgi:LysM repeat protein
MLRKHLILTLFLALLALTFSLLPPKEVSAQPLPQETQEAGGSPPTAADVIEAVNQLRIANGLLPLNTHPALMQVAQWEANALAGGAPGHTRPNGLTLGQWLLSLGYPLSGDLSMDGYRSENWVAAETIEQVMGFWLSDGPHTNTMLSPDRSDIGAAIAVSDQTYVVLETALQTNSGEMQYDAYPILTAIAQSGSVSGVDSSVPQYIIPVKRSTARPDGNVVHKVQYGQSLWSIAVTYNTTINQIRAWNNLGETTEIYDGQVLLVQMGATQPPPPTTTPLPSPTAYFPTATPTALDNLSTTTLKPVVTNITADENIPSRPSSPSIWAGVIVLIALAAGIMGAWVSNTRTPR